jgi:hypothetical protein
LADLCFEQGRDAEAWEHLQALEAEAAHDAGPCGLVAELLAERGEGEAALRWFNRAIGALGTDQVAAVGEPGGPPSLDARLFFGRQRVRRRLGLPADEWDRGADVAKQNRLDFVRLLERAAEASARPAGATMLVWQREEQRRAAARWPSAFPAESHRPPAGGAAVARPVPGAGPNKGHPHSRFGRGVRRLPRRGWRGSGRGEGPSGIRRAGARAGPVPVLATRTQRAVLVWIRPQVQEVLRRSSVRIVAGTEVACRAAADIDDVGQPSDCHPRTAACGWATAGLGIAIIARWLWICRVEQTTAR